MRYFHWTLVAACVAGREGAHEMFQPVGRLMKVPFDFWRHPRAMTRRGRTRRNWPTPSEFDAMEPQAVEAYLRSVGLDAKIQAALATAEVDTD